MSQDPTQPSPLSPRGPYERVERALFGLDHQERDEARAELIRGGARLEIARVVEALSAPLELTRRRAARLLSELPAQRALPPLAEWLAELERSEGWPELREPLTLAARLITTLSEGTSPLLTPLCRHPQPKVRRVALSPATEAEALYMALSDERAEVVERSAELCLRRGLSPSLTQLNKARASHPELSSLTRLLALSDPRSATLSAAASAGDPVALRYCAEPSRLAARLALDLKGAEEGAPEARSAAQERCLISAWRLCQLLSELEPLEALEALEALRQLTRSSSPALRAAAARALPPQDPQLLRLLNDSDEGVKWLAHRAQEGALSSRALQARLGPHERLSSPSARPPYGLRPYDELPEVPRVRAALALCNARFDVNVGVALRSAEAAGFERLFLIGERALSLSPTRGAELAIPLEVISSPREMIERARALGYQLVAVQQTPDSQAYHLASYPPRPLFILGSEDSGLPDELRSGADLAVEIPLFGLIDSLNVATAATCVMMHWRVHHTGEPSLP